ncbi:MAG: hypothetical protein ACJ788_10180 [Ktedonobacteraceae bacterium]
MATRKQTVTPLIDIQSTEFAKQYELGVWWRMYGDEQGQGPVPDSYLISNLRKDAEHGYFDGQHDHWLHHIGFYIGMIHGGILSPATGQLRPDVTTLVLLEHPQFKRGYHVGREAYFHESYPSQHYRYSDKSLIERLRELVTDDPYDEKDNADLWYFCIGDTIGELGGCVFPETPQEQHAWVKAVAECQRLKAEWAQERAAREAQQCNPILQKA